MFVLEYNLDKILPGVYDADIIKGELGSPFCVIGVISPEGLSFFSDAVRAAAVSFCRELQHDHAV